MKYTFIFFGMLFGFLLSRAGATTFDYYAGMFLFENLQLMIVMGVAMGVGVVGIFIMKKVGASALITRDRLAFEGKPMCKGLVIGSTLFGLGWGLSGACPGTVPAMLGEGKFIVLPIIIGLLVGTYLYGIKASRLLTLSSSAA